MRLTGVYILPKYMVKLIAEFSLCFCEVVGVEYFVKQLLAHRKKAERLFHMEVRAASVY